MDAVLGNSQAVVNELRAEGVSIERLGLLYNGIDFKPFHNLPPRLSIRKNLGVNETALLMVCVANLIPYKGHADLIHALGEVNAELPRGWVVALVGRDSGIANDLKDLAEVLGVAEHILWLGERSDAIEIYVAADIGVLCSHEEGFSNSVLEGMASNVAMVVTDVGGNAEAILDGECGIVVPARDPSTLGKAILTLALDKDMRQRMAMAGYARVKQKFAIDSCVSQYSNLYHSLIQSTQRSVQDAIDSPQVDVRG
jgi:glycosyltransferase involved in cell wall biosynthesis